MRKLTNRIVKVSRKLKFELSCEHENGLNPVLVITPVKGNRHQGALTVNKAVLNRKDAAKKIQNIINDRTIYSIDESVAREIAEQGIAQMKQPKNISEKMLFEDVLIKMFECFMQDKQKQTAYKKDEDADLEEDMVTQCYTLLKDGKVYFCIPSRSIKHFLERIEAVGWKSKNFKEQAARSCKLWTGNDAYHRFEYQNVRKNEYWSVRILMDTHYFSKAHIKFAKENVKANENEPAQENAEKEAA